MSIVLPQLPIDELLQSLRRAFETSRSVVLSALPGAGKTTRVPLALLEESWLNGKKILMLEPRRLAARRAASYMAQLVGEKTGGTVGYRIRGNAVVSSRTRIEVVTEGILTRMLHAGPELSGVGLIIFDEFHERSIHADLGLAFTLDVQKHLREDLRVLAMSATLDGLAVAQLLGDAPVIENKGKTFPVETKYARFENDKPIEVRTAEGVIRALAAAGGDVLVFLPGMREIRRVEEKLQAQLPEDVVVHMLHGDLSPAIQDAALVPAPAGKRKIILSTSIAETSLTIDGVGIVVDCGLARTARFDPRRGMSGLTTTSVSRAVADQRRGRAGRQKPGVCFRLWTEKEHEQLPAYPVPEIRTSDLAPLALDLAAWGTPTGEGLAFLDPPPEAQLAQAQRALRDLGALTTDGKLTPHGTIMASLPTHPRLAHMIIRGKELGVGGVACQLAALLEERDFLAGGGSADAELPSRLEEFLRGRGLLGGTRERVMTQARRLMETLHIQKDVGDAADAGLLVALAYPERVARKRPESHGIYQLAGGATASLPPGSSLSRQEFLAIADVETGSGNAKIYLAAPLTIAAIESAFKQEIVTEKRVEWNSAEEKVVARQLRRLGAVILTEQGLEAGSSEIVKTLMAGIRLAGLKRLPWDKDSDRFRSRVLWARKALPELSDIPDLSDAALTDSLEEWLAPFADGIWKLGQLQGLNLLEILQSRCTQHQRRELDRLAPSHLTVPSGSRIALDYTTTENPGLAVKLQELFGLTETPRIGNGRIAVTIRLLSPAGRPLAVTQDLQSFWKTTYPEIRKQLRARYPKHPWPEDPLTAQATRKTIKRR